MSKKLKFLLIFSLCLNIFFVGFLAGEIRHFRPQRGGSGVVKEFIKTHKEQQNLIDTERQKALRMLKKKDFSQDRFIKQVETVSKLQEEMYKEFSLTMAEKLRAMPEEKRDEIIDRIIRRHGKPFGNQKR